MKTCPYCGRANEQTLRYCIECGTELSQTKGEVTSSTKLTGQGRWLIFCGTVVAAVGILLVTCCRHGLKDLPKFVGEKATPYVVYFTPAMLGIAAMVIYERIPKRLAFNLGIIGWFLGLGLIYWYFWFGPGAFSHH